MRDEHALIRFNIPADFVLKHAIPTRAEIAYGFRDGWLLPADVVAVALAKYEASVPMSNTEVELALLLSDDLDRVDELTEALEILDEPLEARARLWLFLALAWVLEHLGDFDDPFEVVEMLYADFDYPDEITGLVRFMPAEGGQAVGLRAIEERWRQYVSRVAAEYRERDRTSN